MNSEFTRKGHEVGVLEPGRRADLLVVDGDPLENIRILQDKSRLHEILMDGKPIDLDLNYDVRQVPLERSYNMWNDVYTQERVEELSAN